MTNTELANASKVILGTTEASAVYIGDTLVWQTASSALPYDTEVEYIQTNNTSYIDTGVTITRSLLNNASYIEYTTECSILVDSAAEGANTLYFFMGSKDQKYYSGLGSTYHSSSTQNDGQKHIFKLIKQNNQVYLYCDNTIIDQYNYSNSKTSTQRNFYLFRCNGASGAQNIDNKKYYAKLQINDDVIFEMIPVRVGQVGYMYDKVSKQLFGTQTEYNFLLGPDKQ